MRKIFTLLMVFVMLPLVAWAATVKPADGSTTKLGTDPISITSAGTYTITGTYSGSYSGNIINVNASGQDVTLILDNVTIEKEAELTGSWCALNIGTGTNVTLILKGTNKLISGRLAGIYVPKGATLTIKEDENTPEGSLEAKSIDTDRSAMGCGIGSTTANKDAGKIIIESGTVTATATASNYGLPGIGGMYSFESIEIKGGTVTATGASAGYYGPGIGLSSMASTTYNENKSGDIKISGGTVVATGGDNGAGIGCGNAKNNEYLNIIIEGNAHVTANGGAKAAGIGGSYAKDATTKVNVTIQGNATVIATGGSGQNGGAGIGGAFDSKNGGEIKILGNASVTATGGNCTQSYGGTGIGAGGKNSDFESIYINTTGTVKATAVADASGIGGATAVDETGKTNVTGTITIENGIIEATGADGYPGIGRNSTTTIKGPAYITAKGGDSADGIDETTLTIEDGSNAVIVTEGITPDEDWDGVLVIDTEKGTGTIYGDELEVKQVIEIPEGVTLTIEEGQTLKGGDNITNKGTIINNGTIEGTINNESGATIQSKIKQEDIKVTVAEKTAYDGKAPEVTVTVKEEEATSGRFEIVSYTYYKIEDGQEIKLEAAPTGAGSYKVVVTVKGTGKADDQGYAYTDAEIISNAVEFTIPQKSITITVEAATKTYGDADPAFTYTLADGALVSDGDLGTITVVRQEADKDKQDVGAEITLTVSYTENSNYKVTVTDAKLTITKKAITVTADNKEKAYGEEDPELTFSVPEGALAYDDTSDDLHITLSRAAGEDVGVYAITGSASEECRNYDVTVTQGSFTIKQAPAVLKFEQEVVEKLTTDEPFINPITEVVPEDAVITYASSDETIATVDEQGEVTILKAGEVEISATNPGDKNYASVTASYTLKIRKPQPVTPDYPDYYNIYVDECEGVTVETSTNVVREGNSMSFTVEVAEGYTAENMTVKVKRSLFGYTDVIEPNEEGKYEIRNIYTEIYITVEGVEKETPTGIEEITGVKVYTKDGSLYVQTPKQEQVVIISISGAVIKNETQIGLKRYDLPRGIYIVRVGTQNYKIRN